LAAVAPIAATGVLRFWFEETSPQQWFGKDPAFDGQVRERFIGLTRQAIQDQAAVERGWVASAEELAFLQPPGSRF
jgi:uncharacterized protein (DUF924 family)